MNITGVRIAGVGHFVPERVITSDEWITSRTGMKERRASGPDESTSDIALAAARSALANANMDPSTLSCIIVATVTPDYAFPATACVVGSKLGVPGIAAFDMEIGCSGFIYGLTIAAGMVRCGTFKRVLLIGAEELTKLVNYGDRSTAVLFGDGAGAVVLEATEHDSFLGAELGADGSEPENLYLPLSGTAQPPPTADDIANKRNTIQMNGQATFRFAVTKMIESTTVALHNAGITPDDVTWLIPHQANIRIIDAAAKQLHMADDRVIVNIDRYGNTSAASIPIALSEAVAAGKLKDGDVILFVGFGAGLSWGAVAWRWSANGHAAA